MTKTNQVAEIGMLIGEPARVAMLDALMDGRALTASELARVAGITPQTASSHLARLIAADLLKVKKQGRHRYYALASPDVAHMLEGIMQIASANAGKSKRKLVVGPRDQAMRRARTSGSARNSSSSGVFTGPGHSAFARMFWRAYSTAISRVIASTPPLLAV